MKYVIFRNRHKLHIPVIVPEHCTHKQITIEGFKPINAGFFHIVDSDVIIQKEGSESLGLKPNIVKDKHLLTNLLINMGSYGFMMP